MSHRRGLGGYCGIFGVYGPEEAASLAVLGLNLLGDGLRDLLDPKLTRKR